MKSAKQKQNTKPQTGKQPNKQAGEMDEGNKAFKQKPNGAEDPQESKAKAVGKDWL